MKKLLSVLLAVILCLAAITPAFAASEKTAFIVVSGMNTFPLYDGDGNKIFPMTTDTVLKMVSDILVPTAAYLVTRDSETFCDKTNPPIKAVFEPLACDKDGNSLYTVTTDTFDGSLTECADIFTSEDSDELGVVRAGMEKFGVENTFFFNYDWRLDPLEHADALNDFIINVKELTGCSRVAVAAFSMGGTVVCSYLYKYGSSDLASLQLCSTAFQGTSCVGSLFTGDLEVDAEGLFRRLAQLTRSNFLENLIDVLNLKLTLIGFNCGLSAFVNGVCRPALPRVYKELLTPIFGYMPGLWALVDDVNYENAKSFMLGDGDCPELIKRIDEYHYGVQARAKELLENAAKDTNIYIIAQYDMQGLPISGAATKSNNDYLIDACYASGGAVCAPLGETLGGGYVQAEDTGFDCLSPDGQIDASTCMFPEYTFFIRDMGHVDYPYGGGADIVTYLASSEKQLTVLDGAYPQFMTYSYEKNTLTDSNGRKPTAADGFFGFFKNILLKMISFVRGIFNGKN